MLPQSPKPKLTSLRFSLNRLAVGLLLLSSTQGQDIEFSSLPNLLDEGTRAFAQGDYATAAHAFAKIEEIYSEEPEWISGTLPEKLLPISGYAAFKANQFDLSAHHFELFLENYSNEHGQKTFATFGLALSLSEAGKIEQAIEQFQAFQDACDSEEQKAVAATHQARLLKDSNRRAEANDLLKQTLEQTPDGRAKTQVALLLIRNSIESNEFEDAFATLRENNWSEQSMPELAALSFSSIELGDYFLENNQSKKALLCYRFVRDKHSLATLQQDAFEELNQRYQNKRKSLGIQANLWDDFYGRILSNTENQLQALKTMPDYSELLRMRKGHAYLNEGRFHEAWLLFENLSQSTDGEISSTSFKYWIHAARSLDKLEASIVIAKAHLEKHPESEEAATTIMDLGASLSDLKRHQEAIDLFTTIIESDQHPNRLEPALFQRALLYVNQRQFLFARNDFDRVALSEKNKYLKPKAQIWSALTYFFEGSFAKAQKAFEHLHATFSDSRHKAEALYRIACCQFAQGSVESCIRTLQQFNDDFPESLRQDEAWLLLGDCHTEYSDFPKAVSSYDKVNSEIQEVYVHAVLQSSYTFEAWDQIDNAIERIERTLGIWENMENSLEARHRLIELYVKNEQPEKAKTTLNETLERFGKEPAAEALLACIQLLDRNDEYPEFLENLKNKYKESKTLVARVRLAEALFLENSGSPHRAEALLLDLANDIPTEELPVEVLAHTGLKLVRIYSPSGVGLLNHLVQNYPNSRYIDFAFYGLAIKASQSGNNLFELAWLNRISQTNLEFPYAQESLLAKANAFSHNDEHQSAQNVFDELLAQRSTLSRNKALALQGLAESHRNQGNLEKAIAYYQRIYILYPGYDDIVANSYAQSAFLLREIGEVESAVKTCREFLTLPRFQTHESRSLIENVLEQALIEQTATTIL